MADYPNGRARGGYVEAGVAKLVGDKGAPPYIIYHDMSGDSHQVSPNIDKIRVHICIESVANMDELAQELYQLLIRARR